MTHTRLCSRAHHNRRLLESLCKKYHLTISGLEYVPKEHAWVVLVSDTQGFEYGIRSPFAGCVTYLIELGKRQTIDIWCGDLFDGVD